MSTEDRIKLWAHLVSQHRAILDPLMDEEDLIDIHDHEHKGPGTIRDHDIKDRDFSVKKIGQVLSESDIG